MANILDPLLKAKVRNAAMKIDVLLPIERGNLPTKSNLWLFGGGGVTVYRADGNIDRTSLDKDTSTFEYHDLTWKPRKCWKYRHGG